MKNHDRITIDGSPVYHEFAETDRDNGPKKPIILAWAGLIASLCWYLYLLRSL